MSQFFSASKMSFDAASTRTARNEAFDIFSISKHKAVIAREKKLTELVLAEKNAEADRLKAANAAAAAEKAVADAQMNLHTKPVSKLTERQEQMATWEKAAEAASEAQRAIKFEQFKGTFNIFRRGVTAGQPPKQWDVHDEEERSRQIGNIAALQRKADAANKNAAAKAKVAAAASRDLAEAHEEFADKTQPTMTKEEETMAAFDRANDFAADAAKARQSGRFSKGEEVVEEVADSENSIIVGANQLAANAAVKRNLDLEEESMRREFAELPVETIRELAEAARDKVAQHRAHSDLAYAQFEQNRLSEDRKKKSTEDTTRKATELLNATRYIDKVLKDERSHIAAENLERMQKRQDQSEVLRRNKVPASTTSRIEKSESLRLQQLLRAQAAASTHEQHGIQA